jgi:hypothetical protein
VKSFSPPAPAHSFAPPRSRHPSSHERLPQLRLLAPPPQYSGEGEAHPQVETSPFPSPSSSPPSAARRGMGKKTPMGLVARARAARVSTLLPLLKRGGARGGMNSLGCLRFDRQGGQGGARLCRAHHPTKSCGARVKRVKAPPPSGETLQSSRASLLGVRADQSARTSHPARPSAACPHECGASSAKRAKRWGMTEVTHTS